MLCFLTFVICFELKLVSQTPELRNYNSVITGAQQFNLYVPTLKNKRVGLITNTTGMVGTHSLVDTLLKLKVNLVVLFGPEHGIRGTTEAGEKINNQIDAKTGLPIISLYGANKKPSAEQLQNIDVLLYDIQDVGVRFYTYISTLCYAMEACAENNKELMVLDRPNPNGFYIDGPVLKPECSSFLGLHSVPIVYGMTCGEYALMINSEGWLKDQRKCKLSVVPLSKYERKCSYALPYKPSPNLPNSTAVLLYPGLGLFEGTCVSLGRGTPFPFQVIGHPNYSDTSFKFTPKSSDLSKEPKYVNQTCYGLDLRNENYLNHHPKKINIQHLIVMYKRLNQEFFFDKNFNYHSGNTDLQQQIKNNLSEKEIRKSWEKDLNTFKKIRRKYLIYPDF